MPIYKPSELHQFLESLGTGPKKGLSQNFLIDGNILRKITSLASLEAGDVVLEIGPGPGSLTQMMLDKGATVIAVEKDAVFADALNRLQTDDKRLFVFCDDVLEFPVEEKLAGFLESGKKAKIIANLPYHLTTPILTRFLPLHELFSSLTIMVQEEVARRMCALPDTSEYGSLTLLIEFYSKPRYGFTVGKKCFYPAPKIDSAVVHLELSPIPLPEEEVDGFFKLKRRAFEQRRKMLRASLKELYSPNKVEEALAAIGMPQTARPEVLSLPQFLKLYHLLKEPR